MDFKFLKFHLHRYSHYLKIRQSHFFTKMINKNFIIKVQLYAHALKQDPLKVIYWYWIAVFVCIRQINLHQMIILCSQKWAKLINYCFESVSEPKRAIYEICYKMWFLFNIFSNCFITFFPFESENTNKFEWSNRIFTWNCTDLFNNCSICDAFYTALTNRKITIFVMLNRIIPYDRLEFQTILRHENFPLKIDFILKSIICCNLLLSQYTWLNSKLIHLIFFLDLQIHRCEQH